MWYDATVEVSTSAMVARGLTGTSSEGSVPLLAFEKLKFSNAA